VRLARKLKMWRAGVIFEMWSNVTIVLLRPKNAVSNLIHGLKWFSRLNFDLRFHGDCSMHVALDAKSRRDPGPLMWQRRASV